MSGNSTLDLQKTVSEEKIIFRTDKQGILLDLTPAAKDFCRQSNEEPVPGSDFGPILKNLFDLSLDEFRFPTGLSEAEINFEKAGKPVKIKLKTGEYFFEIGKKTNEFAAESWEVSDEAMAVLSADFHILQANPKFEIIFGVKNTSRPVNSIFRENEAPFWQAAGTKETASLSLSRETPGGSIKFYSANLCNFSEGRFLFTAHEVSARIRREKTLLKDRERHDILLNNLPDMIFRIDESGVFLDIGGGGINNLLAPDYTAGTVFPRAPVPDSAKAGLLDVVQKVLQSGRPEDYFYETKIGDKTLFLEARVCNIDGAEALVTVRDITEKTRSQNELAESRARLESVFENTSEQIWALDPDYRLLSANTSFLVAFEQMFGRKPLVGQNITNFVGPKIRDYWKALYSRAFEEGTFKKVLVQSGPDGKIRRFSYAFNPIRNRENILIGISVFGTDVTDLKEAEKSILKAKQKAENAVRTKSYFLSVITHELRTPVNAVAGITQLLMSDSAGKIRKDYLSTLKFSAENMTALINDILDFEKIETGKIEFENNDFEIRPLMNNIRNSLLIKAASKGIGFRMNISPKIPGVLSGDKYRLTQILTNLCSNAVKFTEKGFIDLSVDLLRKNEQGFEIKFTVNDSGIGIPADRLERVFERFEQGGSDISRRFGGTGLGLSITKRLIKMQKGEIVLESTENVGTTVTVQLSFARGSGKQISDAFYKGSEFLSLSGVRILSVEDNPVNQLVISSFIKKWSGKVHPVSNGKEALEVLKEKKFDLILTDLLMPEMNGFELSRAIRSQSDDYMQIIPILALTASTSPDILKAVTEAGMNGMIGKPFKAGDLYDTVIRFVMDTPETAYVTEKSAFYLPDLQRFNEISEGDATVFHALLRQTIRQLKAYGSDLAEALRTADEKTVRNIIHTAKSTLHLIGLENLNQELVHTESLFDHSPEIEALAHEAGKTETIFQEIVEHLEKVEQEK